jgi:hypothetical protein
MTAKLSITALVAGILLGAHLTAGRIVNAAPAQLWTMFAVGILAGSVLTLGLSRARRWLRGKAMAASTRDRLVLARPAPPKRRELPDGGDPYRITADEMRSLRRPF